MGRLEVGVILPAYNEEHTIERTVQKVSSELANFLPVDSFEIIIAEDGCEDRTPEIADQLAEKHKYVSHIHSDRRLGRGGALSFAFQQSGAETLVYLDTDMATDIDHLEELVESVRSGEYDIATGSRWLPDSQANRPAKRGIPSLGYNTLVRTFLRSDLQDHQCGFKAFDRGVVDSVLPEVQDDHWFWDTEVLIKAQRRGYKIKEFPVKWMPKGDSKVDLIRDILGMGSQILRTWWELSVSPRITPKVSFGAGSLLIIFASFLMTQYIDVSEILTRMGDADMALIGTSAVAYALSWPVRGTRYRDILVSMGHRERWDFLTGAVFISQTGNLVFPARAGDAVRAYVMKVRRSVPYPTGGASLAIERVFDLLTITILAGTIMIALAATGSVRPLVTVLTTPATEGGASSSGQTAVIVAAGVGCLAILAVFGIIAGARSDRKLIRKVMSQLSDDSYVEYVIEIIMRFTNDLQLIVDDKQSSVRVGLASFIIWSLDVVTAVVVFVAFGVELTPLLVAIAFFAVSVGNLAKVLPLTPGGIGLYEGAFTVIIASLTPIGVTTALTVSVVDHAVKNVVTIAGGIISMGWLNVSLTTAVGEAQTIERSEQEATN
jgi:uncharacterized protein (TIRG00374 family)